MTMCVLATSNLTDIRTSPYPYLVKENALLPSIYESLAADFPSMEEILDGRVNPGSNFAARMSAVKALSHPRIAEGWKEFIRHHTSTEHWREIVMLFGDFFRTAFPELENKVGRKFENWRVLPRYAEGEADIRLDCQFVINTPVTERVSVRPAHIDRPHTIYSGLFYMRDDKDKSEGGNFEIYKWRRPPRFLEKRACIPFDIKKVATVPYQANCYTSFINSPLAAHGVSPRGLTPFPRRYINFIAEFASPTFSFDEVGNFGHKLMRLLNIRYQPRAVGERY